MTVSSEAKRTLVKSPPELWSEVSDAESLARHLDGVQQIRITRAELETAVEWEADGARGSVQLQPSGFGTKVTLSLSRELPTTQPAAAEFEPVSEPATEPDLVPDVEPIADAPFEPEPLASEPVRSEIEPSETLPDDLEPETQPLAAGSDADIAEPHPVDSESTPEASMPDSAVETPRQGFFARLFKRQRKLIASVDESIDAPHEPESVTLAEPEPMPAAEPEPRPAAKPQPATPVTEPEATSEPNPKATSESLPEPSAAFAEAEEIAAPESEPLPEPVQSPLGSVTADLATLEGDMAEQDEAMLIAMLDRLGAAHHRPFSRS